MREYNRICGRRARIAKSSKDGRDSKARNRGREDWIGDRQRRAEGEKTRETSLVSKQPIGDADRPAEKGK